MYSTACAVLRVLYCMHCTACAVQHATACAVLHVLYCMYSTACAVLHTWLMLPASRALSFFAPDLPMHSELKDRKNRKDNCDLGVR